MNYNTRKVLDIRQIEDKDKAFHDFAEGSPSLENLLKILYENNVETIACCRGHSKEQEAYIKFKINDSTVPFYQKLLTIIQNIKDSEFIIQNTKEIITIDLRFPFSTAESVFQTISKMASNIKSEKYSPSKNYIDTFNTSYELTKLSLESGIYSEIKFTKDSIKQNEIEIQIYNEDMANLEQNEQLNILKYKCSSVELQNLYNALKPQVSKIKQR